MKWRAHAVCGVAWFSVACSEPAQAPTREPGPGAPVPTSSAAEPAPWPGDAGPAPASDAEPEAPDPWGADGPCGCYAELSAAQRPLRAHALTQRVPEGVSLLQGDLSRGHLLWGQAVEGQGLRLWTVSSASPDAAPVLFEVQAAEAAFATPRAAVLSADGLTLLLLSSDGRRFGELSRGSIEQPFAGPLQHALFSALELAAARGAYQAAALSADRLRLLLRQERRDAPEFPLALSERRTVSEPWPEPSPLTDAALQEPPGSAPRTPLALDHAASQLVFTQGGQLQVACRANDGATFEPAHRRALRAGSAWTGQGVCSGLPVGVLVNGLAWSLDDSWPALP